MSYKIKESIKIENGKTYFLKERLQDISWDSDGDRSVDYDDCSYEDFATTAYNKVTDTDRWSTHYEQVFTIGDKYYMTYYSEGSDESPYEYDDEWIEVTEVVPKEVIVTKYVPKKTINKLDSSDYIVESLF